MRYARIRVPSQLSAAPYHDPMKDDRSADPRLRRRSPRVVGPFKGRWCGALTVPLVIQDVSVGGCLILSSNTKLPAQIMTLEIDLPGGDTVRVDAQPLYVRKNVGFAMKFVNVPDATGMRLQRLVTGLDAAGRKPTPRR
jgi:hypothetical protein